MATHASITSNENLPLRAQLADAIEAAIAALDLLDGDPDLEPTLAGYQAPGALDESEPDDDGEDGGDDESTLGWSEAESLRGARGSPADDREEDLGWTAKVSQLSLGEGQGDGDETALERAGAGFIRSGGDDSEDENEGDTLDEHGEHDESDSEPSLGSLTSCLNPGDQNAWGSGGTSDLEAEHDGREPGPDEGSSGYSGGATAAAGQEAREKLRDMLRARGSLAKGLSPLSNVRELPPGGGWFAYRHG